MQWHALILVLATMPAFAQVYKCTQNGVVTYSERPCGDKPKVVDIKVYQPTPQERLAATERAATDIEDAQVVDLTRQKFHDAAAIAESTNRIVRSSRRQRTCEFFKKQVRETDAALVGLTNPVMRDAAEKRRKQYEADADAACANGYP